MPIVDKILAEVMRGTQDKNIRFSELQKLLEALGFQCRIKGDHLDDIGARPHKERINKF